MARRNQLQPWQIFILLLVLAGVVVVLIRFRNTTNNQPATAPTLSADHIRIATWNLHVFSDKRVDDADPGNVHPPNIGLMAKIINESQFDLVACQEIRSSGEGIDKLLNALDQPWRSTSLSPMTGHERYAFLYKSDRLTEVGKAHLMEAAPDAYARTPYIATFRCNQFEFTILTIHAHYGTNGKDPQREKEISQLADYAKNYEQQSENKNLIILGDFNDMVEADYLTYFDRIGWKRLVNDRTNLSDTQTFDNILIDPRYTTRWAGQSGAIKFDQLFFKGQPDSVARNQVSDHRPAWADFNCN